MISPPDVIQTEAQLAAVIHITVPRSEMQNVFGPAVSELMAVLAAQGIVPLSAVFAHHLTTSASDFDFELGAIIAGTVTPAGRVKPGQLPAARVARTAYTGPYEGLHGAWTEFEAWMETNGHKPAGSLWEIYSAGPQSTSDPGAWCTELFRPLDLPSAP
jgi:effector-binding domain-containing protein